jgi:hypothetical protein
MMLLRPWMPEVCSFLMKLRINKHLFFDCTNLSWHSAEHVAVPQAAQIVDV